MSSASLRSAGAPRQNRRVEDMARWGFEVTSVLPSGRIFIRLPKGKIAQCASLNKAYNVIREWRKNAER